MVRHAGTTGSRSNMDNVLVWPQSYRLIGCITHRYAPDLHPVSVANHEAEGRVGSTTVHLHELWVASSVCPNRNKKERKSLVKDNGLLKLLMSGGFFLSFMAWETQREWQNLPISLSQKPFSNVHWIRTWFHTFDSIWAWQQVNLWHMKTHFVIIRHQKLSR